MKTATELGITEAEHRALQRVAIGLASGAYVHKKIYSSQSTHEKMFNMNAAYQSDDCGTVACIGGWVAREMGRTPIEADEYVIDIDESSSNACPAITKFRVEPE